MRNITAVILLFIVAPMLYAQTGWNWPDDAATNKITQEKQAFYKIQIQLDNYPSAFSTLMWLYTNTPDLHPSIYVDGSKVIDKLMENPMTPERKQALMDSALWTYDMRMKYFNDDNALDRKAFTAFKFYYKNPAKYPLLNELYEALFSGSYTSISDFNLTPYMTMATYYYKTNPEVMTPERVLDVHETISTVIEEKITSGESRDKLNKEQDKIDAFLSSLGDVLNCDFIANKLVPKMEANPEDLGTAKKIFSYSLKAKCSDQDYFIKSGMILYQTEPSYGLAKTLGDKFYSNQAYEDALEFYQKAETLAQTPDQSYECKMGKAQSQNRLGNKSRARAMAYEAISIRNSSSTEAFNLIGNLYFGSFNDCKGGESKVKDRAVYIAAYEMYEKAGNKDQMQASKQQFPSIEEIFSENMEEGQKVTIDCWINESVVIQRR